MAVLLAATAGLYLDAQSAGVTYERILKAAAEPQNWLTYGGTYMSQRYSGLNQITPANVANLESKWVVQNQVFGAWQSNPLVVDGMMYVTQRPNDVMAIDAKTGKVFWLYRYTPSPEARVCCGANNRGVAILGDTLYMGTLDAHLIALDARSGKPLWNVEVGDVKLAYSITMMPLIVKDKVVVGVGGGEFGIRGYVAAYDAKTGKEAWKFYTIPAPGEPGNDSWQGESWKTGAGSVWVTGSYDPDLNLTYWGIGNPGPDWNPDQRRGDNLYTDSVVALDADTGKLRWHFQFTPNDAYDYDSVQVPVLADIEWQGKPRKVMMWANRNGYFYVARPGDRRVPAGQAVRQGELGERPRRQGPSGSDAAAVRLADLAGQPGRDQLVSAVVQSAHRSLLRVGVGKLRNDLPQGGSDLSARAQLLGRRLHSALANPRRADRRHRPAQPHQQLDR